MHIGPVAALIRQWPVIPGSFHRPGRHSISVPTFGGWSTDAGRSPDSRWTHQAWAALSPSERKPWVYPGLPRLQPETGKALDRLVEFYLHSPDLVAVTFTFTTFYIVLITDAIVLASHFFLSF